MKRVKKKINLKFLLLIVSFLFLTITTLSSVINIYEKRHKILKKTKSLNKYSVDTIKHDLAKSINSGGYVLLFRHAEREKWIDVQMYDSIEINKKLLAENTYFKNAVCLSERGIVQAKMMGEIIKDLNMPIHKVISSPSCRARQTANLAFGGYDEIKNIFLHGGPFNQNPDEFGKQVGDTILKYVPPKNSNIIISAHNSVIENVPFSEIRNDTVMGLEESGFYVIKNDGNKLILVNKFYSFHKFNQIFQIRPID